MELSNFKAETTISDSIATDEFNCANNFVGAYQHPKFGKLQSSFATQFGIYNNNIDISEIKTLADNNLIMPPKSTYIEPKFRSGLLVYELY